MSGAILSGDLPRSSVLSALLLVIAAFLAVAPFAASAGPVLGGAVKILVMIVVVASFDVLIGYTGIISFAHTAFFAIGAYGVGISLRRFGPEFPALLGGLAGALIVTALAAGLIGFCSMRVRTVFFAMLTLAAASALSLFVLQFYDLTGGPDGLVFQIPRFLGPANIILSEKIFGRTINGTLLLYYIIFIVCGMVFLFLLRLVNSPFGRVLQAIRENEVRAEAIGFSVLSYRVQINCIAACCACLAGGLYALWLRYVGPDTTVSLQIMLDVLLMAVIGGTGTIYGAVVGVTLFVLAEAYLRLGIAALHVHAAGIPGLDAITDPNRWLLWLGLLFVLSVYFFPDGVVGTLRRRSAARGQRVGKSKLHAFEIGR
jgi:branched-chain amino acid transport system permease protein